MSDAREVHLHLYLHDAEPDPRIDEVLGVVHAVYHTLQQVQQEGITMSAELDALTASVAADATVEASAITLIQGLSAQIVAAGTDPAALTALTTALDAQAASLAAAVEAGTTPPATPAA